MVDTLEINNLEPAPAEAPDQRLLGEEKKAPEEDNKTPSEEQNNEQKPKEENKTDERPDWLPEKYKSVEDYVKAHSEAEKKITELSTKLKAQEGMSDDEISETLQTKGLDLQNFKDEFAKDGKLSEDSYKKLEEVGFGKDIVDSYIEGMNALAANMASEVKSVAGGDEEYTKMINWASQNLSDEEIDAYDRAVATDTATAKLAAQALFSKYKDANGKTPNLKTGESAPTAGDTYRDWSEVTQDMKDPRYKKSEAFREDVEKKLARSKLK
jgi:hypothetical protein